jgi:hypothetical protein
MNQQTDRQLVFAQLATVQQLVYITGLVIFYVSLGYPICVQIHTWALLL